MIDLQQKEVPHQHYCTGCDRRWMCRNVFCSDCPPQWCRKWCVTCPPELESLEHVQKSGHDLLQIAQALEIRGEVALVSVLMGYRDKVLARCRELGEEIERGHPAPTAS